MCRLVLGLGSVALAVLILAAAGRAQEEEVALDKVPAAVMKAVKARFKKAQVTGASKETEAGKLVYEVTIKDQGQNIDVTLSPAGELLMIEKTIAVKALPKAVGKALEGKYPKATYKIVEEIIKVEKKKETLDYYEVALVTADKQALEVKIAANGKILGVEKEGAD